MGEQGDRDGGESDGRNQNPANFHDQDSGPLHWHFNRQCSFTSCAHPQTPQAAEAFIGDEAAVKEGNPMRFDQLSDKGTALSVYISLAGSLNRLIALGIEPLRPFACTLHAPQPIPSGRSENDV